MESVRKENTSMGWRRFSVLLVVAVAACSSPVTETQVPAEPEATMRPVAFVGVHVIPMDSERVLDGQTIIVENGRIAAMGPAEEADIPDGAVIVDGGGKYLLPGLAEMHGHIPPPTETEEFIESVLFMYVANGITTVRGMQGRDGQLELRERARQGELIAPNLYLAGPAFSGNTIESPEQAIERVRTQYEEGWDLLKVQTGLSLDEYDAMANTANRLGMRFGGHVPAEVGIEHAIEMGQETFEHLDGYIPYLDGATKPVDDAQMAEIVQKTKEAGAWVVPTMAMRQTSRGVNDLDTLLGYEEIQYMPPDQVEQWTNRHRTRLSQEGFNPDDARQLIDNRMRLLGALHDGGVRVLLGTDSPQQFSVPGFSIHREFQLMAAAGMSPYEIIESGTANVGLYFEDQDDFGTIAVGKRADLLLLHTNPLEDIANVRDRAGVMVRGAWLPEESIQERLAAIAASYN